MTTCVMCGGNVTEKIISREFTKNNKNIEISGLNAFVCEKCGEAYFSSEETKRIENILGNEQ